MGVVRIAGTWVHELLASDQAATEYTVVSPLSPRPRRSYWNTVKFDLKRDASVFVDDRSENAPTTRINGGPVPE